MYKYIKRIFDFIIALMMLIVLSLPMLIIAIAIKLEDKGPALFMQERTGKNGKPFKLYKFRSMKVNNNVRDFKKENQMTKVGKFIRKTSLDEIPQMINILKGDMSFIGPRPWIPEYYENMNKNQRKRVDVLPGLTGLAQANGRNGISIFDKINYDLEYVKNYSFIQDIKIMFQTIITVFKKENVDISKLGIKEEIDALKNQHKKQIKKAKKKLVNA